VSLKRIGIFDPFKLMRAVGKGFLLTLGSITILGIIWLALQSLPGSEIPGPWQTLPIFWNLISNPFYDLGPNDKGIGLQFLNSLGNVFTGFLVGTIVAVPLGVVMGASSLGKRLFNPIVQVLRPVSPMAWFPIGLATMKAAGPALMFIIFITSLWPTVINTAFGISSLPKDYSNVARVFKFSRFKYVTKVLLPHSLPHILTGMRLSLGIAWMVIVAAEMLAGGTGIGFFVWDSWNALSLERILSAILLIGLTGLVFDRGFEYIARKFTYGV
jgi:nitrate/nitrite transport system permease protein